VAGKRPFRATISKHPLGSGEARPVFGPETQPAKTAVTQAAIRCRSRARPEISHAGKLAMDSGIYRNKFPI